MLQNFNVMRSFRNVALAEGISFLVLLLVAMPLKYFAGFPLAVKYVGWAHGLLFVLYLILCAVVAKKFSWRLPKILVAVVASVVPFGPFVLEKHLKREQADSTL